MKLTANLSSLSVCTFVPFRFGYSSFVARTKTTTTFSNRHKHQKQKQIKLADSSAIFTYRNFSRNLTRLAVPLKESALGGGFVSSLSSTAPSQPRNDWPCNSSLSTTAGSLDCANHDNRHRCLVGNRTGDTGCSCITTARYHRSPSPLCFGGFSNLTRNNLTGSLISLQTTAGVTTAHGSAPLLTTVAAHPLAGSQHEYCWHNNKWPSSGPIAAPAEYGINASTTTKVGLDKRSVANLAQTVRTAFHWPNAVTSFELSTCSTHSDRLNKLIKRIMNPPTTSTIKRGLTLWCNDAGIRALHWTTPGSSGQTICKRHRLIGLGQHQYASFSGSSEHDDQRCWRCDKPINVSGQEDGAPSKSKVAVCDKCGSIQPISADVNFFSLFNLRPQFDIDLDQLRFQFLRLQQNMHPDMNVNRSNTETGYSLDNSSIINSAYKTLRDPYERALYLLRLEYNITIDEGNVETEPELLLEIMELNEDIELAKDKPSLESVEERIEEDIREIIENVKQAFDDKNGAEARKHIVRFSYYQSALAKVKDQLVNM